MKKITLILASIIFTFSSYSQSQVTPSTIDEVVVFLSKAQITRSASTSIPKGNMEVVLNGLSANIDPNSIQVSGQGALTILGIRHERNYLSSQEDNAGVKVLRDSLAYYKARISNEEALKSIYKKEETLLTNNQVISGKDRGVTVSELKAMADFYTNRMMALSKKTNTSNVKIQNYNIRLKAIQRQLNELNAYYKKNTSSIVVEVSAKNPTPAKLKVDYVVYNAGWQPIYDIRSAGADQPLELNYKANIVQNTGVNWDDVKLTLSTSNPNLSNTKPEVYPWYLNFQQEQVYRRLKGQASGVRMESAPMEIADAGEDMEMLAEVVTTADFTQTVNTSLSTSFSISIPYSVASGGKATTVDIRKESIEAEYTYAVAPRLDQDAFLLASISDWDQYDLLPGSANLFFEGTYVGKTYINPENVNDKLELSLGRDKHIVVERKPIKDFTSKKLIGTNRKESFAYEISVRNTNKSSVKLRVEDQVPVSSNSEIEIEVLDTSGAEYGKVTGKLIWELDVAAGSTEKKQFSYEVKYPKNKRVVGL